MKKEIHDNICYVKFMPSDFEGKGLTFAQAMYCADVVNKRLEGSVAITRQEYKAAVERSIHTPGGLEAVLFGKE